MDIGLYDPNEDGYKLALDFADPALMPAVSGEYDIIFESSSGRESVSLKCGKISIFHRTPSQIEPNISNGLQTPILNFVNPERIPKKSRLIIILYSVLILCFLIFVLRKLFKSGFRSIGFHIRPRFTKKEIENRSFLEVLITLILGGLVKSLVNVSRILPFIGIYLIGFVVVLVLVLCGHYWDVLLEIGPVVVVLVGVVGWLHSKMVCLEMART